MTIINVQINSLEVSSATTNIRYNYVAKFITNTVNRVVNANWRFFKPAVEPTFKKMAGYLIETVLKSFLNNVALEDVFMQI